VDKSAYRGSGEVWKVRREFQPVSRSLIINLLALAVAVHDERPGHSEQGDSDPVGPGDWRVPRSDSISFCACRVSWSTRSGDGSTQNIRKLFEG
jgi:hypothetical protein